MGDFGGNDRNGRQGVKLKGSSGFSRAIASFTRPAAITIVSCRGLTSNPEITSGLEYCVPPVCQVCWLPWTSLD